MNKGVYSADLKIRSFSNAVNEVGINISFVECKKILGLKINIIKAT